MICVLPYMAGLTDDLRFSLRSLDKWGPEVEDVYLVGEKAPKWFQGHHLSHPDCYDDRFKEKNIWYKMKAGAEHATDMFLSWQDDYFLTNWFRDEYWYDKKIRDRMNQLNPEGSYYKTLQNTLEVVGNHAFYDVHAPMVVETAALEKVSVDWNKPFGYCAKTLIASNSYMIGMPMKDCKIRTPATVADYQEQINGREWFSTDDLAWDDLGEMRRFLEQLYPDKSRWES